MSYIGKTPTVGNFQVCDAISTVNNQAAYTMQVGSVNVSPESANHMIVSLNGVIQKPTDAFTVSGSTITFASNLVTGDVINFIQILGNVLDLGVPSDATVSTAKLASTSVTAAKLNNDIITGQTAEATIATDDLILLSDTSASGALRKMTRANFVSGVGATATAEFSAYVSSDITVNNNSDTLITFQTELFDPDGVYTPSNGKFIAPSDGIYIFGSNIWSYDGSEDIKSQRIMLYINGSMKQQVDFIGRTNRLVKQASHISTMLDLDQNDYVQIYMNIVTYDTSAVAIEASGSVYQNNFYGFRLPT